MPSRVDFRARVIKDVCVFQLRKFICSSKIVNLGVKKVGVSCCQVGKYEQPSGSGRIYCTSFSVSRSKTGSGLFEDNNLYNFKLVRSGLIRC